uniref:Uncharacterized protein n=1 Tax=Myotis myotis TaxID=51298 RepID=A0A7J8AMQ3_MYOMY|nr:hypothetical protein mMyoMyo1_008041 [Myotis myotis]
MLVRLKLSQRLLTLSSSFWVLYSFCFSGWVFFASSYFRSLTWFLGSSRLLLDLCILFFISVSVCLISDWPFSIFLVFSLRSLKVSPSSLEVCRRFLSNLIMVVLNSMSSISLLSSISFICDMFLCLRIFG